MSDAWIVVAVVGAATIASKAAGPVLVGRRQLPTRVQDCIDLLAPVMLVALVVATIAFVAYLAYDYHKRAVQLAQSLEAIRAAGGNRRGP